MPRLPKPTLALAAILALLVLGFAFFCSTGHDDSHITYWAAYALQKLGKIANYNGDRIEQSSSLAHVLLLAFLGAVTRVQLPTLGPITSIVFGVVAIPLVARLARLAAPGSRGTELLLGTAACFVYWSFGGLETTLAATAAVCLVLTCAQYLQHPTTRRLLAASAAILLYLTVRPESVVVLGCVLAAALGYAIYRLRWTDPSHSRLSTLRPARLLTAVGAGQSVALLALRRAYFGVLFPNPVYSKAPGLDLATGLEYLRESLFPAGLWVIAGLAVGVYHTGKSALTDEEPQHAAVLSAAFAVAYVAFIVLVGGDWMIGGRFFAHVFPLLCVVTMIGITRAIKSSSWSDGVVALLVASNLFGVVRLAYRESTGRPIWTTAGLRAQIDARAGDRGYSWFELTNLVHLRDTTIAAALVDLVGQIRAKAPDRQLVLMSSQAGMVAYHAFKAHHGGMRFEDLCSLSTRDFLSCTTPIKVDQRRVGALLSYEAYFAKHEHIDAACGTKRPDIVFGLAPQKNAPTLRANGYTLVVDQRGPMRGEKTDDRRTADAFMSDAFIAVDTQLFETLGLGKQERVIWDVR